MFVITADHCASSGGIAQLPVFRYRIPLWIYSPKHIAPQRVECVITQIDVGPTLLGLLGMDYRSQFYGVDSFQLEPGRERALIGNYQRLGYLRNDQLIELAPHRHVGSVRPEYLENRPQPPIPLDHRLAIEAVGAIYQTASYRFKHGRCACRRTPGRMLPYDAREHRRRAGAAMESNRVNCSARARARAVRERSKCALPRTERLSQSPLLRIAHCTTFPVMPN